MQREVRARVLVGGRVRGPLVVVPRPISLLGEFDPREGVVRTSEGAFRVVGKVLAIPTIRGSTVGSYVLYAAKKAGTAPLGIVVLRPEPIIVTGAVISGIPLFEPLDPLSLDELPGYREAKLDPDRKVIVLEG